MLGFVLAANRLPSNKTFPPSFPGPIAIKEVNGNKEGAISIYGGGAIK